MLRYYLALGGGKVTSEIRANAVDTITNAIMFRHRNEVTFVR